MKDESLILLVFGVGDRVGFRNDGFDADSVSTLGFGALPDRHQRQAGLFGGGDVTVVVNAPNLRRIFFADRL